MRVGALCAVWLCGCGSADGVTVAFGGGDAGSAAGGASAVASGGQQSGSGGADVGSGGASVASGGPGSGGSPEASGGAPDAAGGAISAGGWIGSGGSVPMGNGGAVGSGGEGAGGSVGAGGEPPCDPNPNNICSYQGDPHCSPGFLGSKCGCPTGQVVCGDYCGTHMLPPSACGPAPGCGCAEWCGGKAQPSGSFQLVCDGVCALVKESTGQGPTCYR